MTQSIRNAETSQSLSLITSTYVLDDRRRLTLSIQMLLENLTHTLREYFTYERNVFIDSIGSSSNIDRDILRSNAVAA